MTSSLFASEYDSDQKLNVIIKNNFNNLNIYLTV